MSKGKEPITNEILNKLIHIVFGENINNVDEAIDVFFSTDTLRKNNTITRYLEYNMSENLRRCMYNKQCTKIGQPKEKNLTEDDIITILRAVLRLKGGYKLVGLTDSKNIVKTRVYKITTA